MNPHFLTSEESVERMLRVIALRYRGSPKRLWNALRNSLDVPPSRLASLKEQLEASRHPELGLWTYLSGLYGGGRDRTRSGSHELLWVSRALASRIVRLLDA